MEEEVYEVEKVVDFRVNKENIEYLVKWIGWPSESNSWVAAQDMNCPALIDEFEKENPSQNYQNLDPFKRGYQAEKLIRATIQDGNVMYLVKFHEKENPELISTNIARICIPQQVIEYYQDKIEWV